MEALWIHPGPHVQKKIIVATPYRIGPGYLFHPLQPEKLRQIVFFKKRGLQFKGGRITPHFFQPMELFAILERDSTTGSLGDLRSQWLLSTSTGMIHPNLLPPELVIKTNPEVGDMKHEILLFAQLSGSLYWLQFYIPG